MQEWSCSPISQCCIDEIKRLKFKINLIQPLYYCIGEVILNKRVFSIDVII